MGDVRDARYAAQPVRTVSAAAPIQIGGVEYFTAADIHREIGVARQTLWRWRKAGKIPRGRRYRDRLVVFTHEELEAIREYSNRLEPEEAAQPNQLKLFKANSARRQL
jgi:predicted DNA-binding transcriptional regulator AlpA